MKKFIFLLTAVFLLLVGVGAVKAAVSVGDQETFESKLGSPVLNKETFDFQSLYGILGSLNVAIMGCSDATKVGKDDDGKVTFEDNPNSRCPQGLRTGAVGGMGNVLASMYAYPPVSGMDYLASVGENMGIVPSAYAQTGAGFSSLSPILPLWRAFRNIAYVFFVILFVVIGIAIMFRIKISPQAVITIQSAIPKIVIALLLVTFSYAIAGFMVDLIYVFLILFIHLLAQNNLIAEPAGVADAYINGGLFALASAMFGPILNGSTCFLHLQGSCLNSQNLKNMGFHILQSSPK